MVCNTNSILYLLEQLLRNVRKQDDWQDWVPDDEWTEEDVKKCLQECIIRVKAHDKN